ncbi:MAG: SDR family oxidoreductase [Pseudomonadota bacterium]
MAGRCVIITGAGRAVGAACARRFAAAGDKLVLADRDEDAVRSLMDDLGGGEGAATFVAADVADRLHVHNIVAEALEAHGRVDVLAHLANARAAGDFLEIDEDAFDAVLKRNVTGAFLINQAFARQLAKQADEATGTEPGGAIVNLISDEAIMTRSDHVAFAASQGGLKQLTKAVALAVAPYGARANAVGVGPLKGDVKNAAERKEIRASAPLGRMGDAQDAAEAVFFLASPEAAFITGQTLYLDGGRLSGAVSAPAEKAE